MNQLKASPRIEYTQVEMNSSKSDCLLIVTLIDLGIIPRDACLVLFVNTCLHGFGPSTWSALYNSHATSPE
jgi:hypothetical protein